MTRSTEEIFSINGPVRADETINPPVFGCPAATGYLGYYPKRATTRTFCGEVDDLLEVSCTLAKYHEGSHICHEDDFWFIWKRVPQLIAPGDSKWPAMSSNKTSTRTSGGRGDRSSSVSQTSASRPASGPATSPV